MARIRSVHPSLFTDEAWVSCSPIARILYIGLWTDADDQGLFEWKPLQIKMRILPGDMAEAVALLAELEAVNLIKSYEAGGARYGAIRDFRKFQRPQKPNAIHPITEIIAEYVSLPATDPEPVSDRSTTDPVNRPQMEDGGGRGEETAKSNDLSVTHEREGDFEDWWKAYPGATAKPKAKAAYAAAIRVIGGPDAAATLAAGLERTKASARWANPTYTRPNPVTWLTNAGWLDRPDQADAKPGTGPPAGFSPEQIAARKALLESLN